jgi:hypothetical protein
MLVSVHLETVLISVQDRCTICAKSTIGSEIILDAPDGTPSCCGCSGSLFGSIWGKYKSQDKIGARFGPNVPRAWKSSWAHPMELLGDVGLFGDSVNIDTR